MGKIVKKILGFFTDTNGGECEDKNCGKMPVSTVWKRAGNRKGQRGREDMSAAAGVAVGNSRISLHRTGDRLRLLYVSFDNKENAGR